MAETTTEQAKETVQQAAGQAKEQVQQVAGQARGRVREQVDTRSTEAGQRVSGTATDLRSVADTLREQGKDQPAKFAAQAAERAERLGGYLERSDADRIIADVEDFARRQPWVVGLGAAALGFAAARFMKASSAQRYQSQQSGPPAYRRPEPTQSLIGTTGPGYVPPTTPTGGNGGSQGGHVPGVGLGGTPSAGI